MALFAMLPPMQLSDQTEALIMDKVEDPPWAAVQQRGRQLPGKIREQTHHELS